MESFFSEEQLNNMSRENLIELMKIMKAQAVKKDMEIQLLKDKHKELEFMNALLSDRLALAQRKQFGSSSENMRKGTNSWSCSMRQRHPLTRRQLSLHLRKSIPLRTSGKNAQERRKRIFQALKSRRRPNTRWPGKTVTARIVARSTRLLPKKP